MLKQRIITGLILTAIAALALWMGGWLLRIVALAVFLAINYEYFTSVAKLPKWEAFAYCALSFLLPLGYIIGGFKGLSVMLGLAFVAAGAWEICKVECDVLNRPPLERLNSSFLGLVYTGFLGSFLTIIQDLPIQQWFLVWFVAVVIATDTFAYFGGRLIGGRQLAARISPKKTIAGAASGLLFAIIIGVAIAGPLRLEGSSWKWVSLAGFFSLAAQFGDLFESLVKRSAGIKDSGAILPGHGGVLDRVDGFLFAVPAAAVVLSLFPY